MSTKNKIQYFCRVLKEKVFGSDGILRCSECKSKEIFSTEFFKITSLEKVRNRWVSHGYKTDRHCCIKCMHIWEDKK